MNQSRRDFIKNSALAATAVAILPGCISGSESSELLTGVQLYSIRDDMMNDPMGSLEELAKIGYKYVEHANYVERKFYGWNATEFRKILDDLGIQMPSGHTVLGADHWDDANNDFTDAWKYTVEDAAVMGQDFVISPWLDENIWKDYDQLLTFLDIFNKSGELCQKSGMKFGYHNHHFEFNQEVNGQKLYDIILTNTDPDLVIQQLDFGNMLNGGATAREWIVKYPGRFPSVHVKDEIKSQNDEEEIDGETMAYESTVLGTGVVGVQEILGLLKNTGGTKQFIIEQESYQGKSPIECVQEDLEIMKRWGY